MEHKCDQVEKELRGEIKDVREDIKNLTKNLFDHSLKSQETALTVKNLMKQLNDHFELAKQHRIERESDEKSWKDLLEKRLQGIDGRLKVADGFVGWAKISWKSLLIIAAFIIAITTIFGGIERLILLIKKVIQ